MKGALVSVGFIPLVDAAPLIAAQEMGFAAEEGLALDLVPAPSWASLRDMLAFGRVDAAHMLAPVPVATAMGLGGSGTPLCALSVLSMNGNVIGVKNDLARKMRDAGHDFGFSDARAAGEALIAAAGPGLRIGVPFPFSMHGELLYYWLSALGLPAPQGVEVRTVPPPLMAEAIASGEIDAFCVGEPWGSIAVEKGVAHLLLPSRAIWQGAPEKVLAVRAGWADDEPELSARLIRAVWRAQRWLFAPDSRALAGELLSRPEYLDMPVEVIDRALSGNLCISPDGDLRQVADFVTFYKNGASFPWRSQAQWIGYQLAARMGLDRVEALRRSERVFRPDLYRAALTPAGATLPTASSKIEGSIDQETPVASGAGRLFLGPDSFFDGKTFDPSRT
ncbi:ABC transporter substrate-binding protein [Maritimibacter sp. DP1N21-5]|uniref:ABC transporter substrate-binding protein n=1 Tax=Maritimibacter sp. DP1N21-5 TaxID=2836867 RepID=UPI001C43F99E|nr:ABC transporter substrate-binding protein [Maritimibacter sp. DP1N21-5]